MSQKIEVTSHVARDFLQNAAYFNTVPKVVWEYVSNSVDNPKKGLPVDVDVHISKARIVVSDNGCGMSRDGLRNFFQMHAENIRRGRGESVRGRYGTGKCAAFGIADVFRVETVQNGYLNIIELSRKEISGAKSGEPFPVRDIAIDKTSTQEDGTRIIILDLNIRNIELPATIAYVERHLGRQLQNHRVIINDHICEYQEPYSSWHKTFEPDPTLSQILGDLKLTIKVSPVPLDKERTGIDILSRGIWHDTTSGTIESTVIKRISGEVDVPILEDRYDEEKIPPFDNTRNMTLNITNPIVASLLGWIDECLHKIASELEVQEKEKRESDEAKRLEKQAQQLARILNDDFRSLQMELEKIRRAAKKVEQAPLDDLIPGNGSLDTEFQLGGPEHGEGTRGELAGTGEEERRGSALLEGNEKGDYGTIKTEKRKASTFNVEYKHEELQSPRSHYDRERRTIVINLDHPQIARALKEVGGINSRQFQEITYEIAFVEYAIALGHEKMHSDEFYAGSDALYDIRETINRISRI